MHIRRALHRPEPDREPDPGPLARLRSWLLEDSGGSPTRADRAFVAALLRSGPPH